MKMSVFYGRSFLFVFNNSKSNLVHVVKMS